MLNKVQLIGHTGAIADIRTTPAGRKLASLRVATGRTSGKDAERRSYTTWHQVEIWSPTTLAWLEGADLPMGAKVYVEGEIRNERYTDQNGEVRFVSKIVVASPQHEVKSLDRKVCIGDADD